MNAPQRVGDVVNLDDLRRRAHPTAGQTAPQPPAVPSPPPRVPAKYHVQLDDLEQTAAVTKSRSWLEDRPTPWLLLAGPVGAGKSTIAGALAVALDTPYRCSFWPVGALIAAMKAEFDQPPEGHPVRVKIDKRHDLVLDDLGTELDSPWQTTAITDIIANRYDHQLGMIGTTNLTFGQLTERFGERTGSRLREMCTVIVVAGEDRRRPA